MLILNKLVEFGDHRGYANLGCYYFNINRELAVSYFEKASELGNVNSKLNLAKHYIEIGNLEKSTMLCEELANSNYIPVYMLLAQIYGWKGNFPKMIETLGKGIEFGDQNCMKSLELSFNNNLIQIKQFLLGLVSNDLIKNKIDQIVNIENGNGVMLNMSFSK